MRRQRETVHRHAMLGGGCVQGEWTHPLSFMKAATSRNSDVLMWFCHWFQFEKPSGGVRATPFIHASTPGAAAATKTSASIRTRAAAAAAAVERADDMAVLLGRRPG